MVANDAGDRVTPAVVAYTENEEVLFPSFLYFEISKITCIVICCSFSGCWIGSKTK